MLKAATVVAKPQGGLDEGLLDAVRKTPGKAAIIGGEERPQHVLMLGKRAYHGSLEVVLPARVDSSVC